MAAMDVISRLRDIELAEAGKADSVRTPPGSNNVKYNTAFYGHPVSDPKGVQFRWCVVFQWWCCNMAGINTSIFPKTAGVAAVKKFFSDHHRFFDTPQQGDMVIFKHSHIGFVESVDPTFIVTIEGNSSDRVKRRKYRRDDADIDGYCRPDYPKVVQEVDVTEAELRQVVRDEVKKVLDSEAKRVQGIISWERYLQVLLDAARTP
jgi:CHAP domain